MLLLFSRSYLHWQRACSTRPFQRVVLQLGLYSLKSLRRKHRWVFCGIFNFWDSLECLKWCIQEMWILVFFSCGISTTFIRDRIPVCSNTRWVKLCFPNTQISTDVWVKAEVRGSRGRRQWMSMKCTGVYCLQKKLSCCFWKENGTRHPSPPRGAWCAHRNKTLFSLVIIKKKSPIQPNLSCIHDKSPRNNLQELWFAHLGCRRGSVALRSICLVTAEK